METLVLFEIEPPLGEEGPREVDASSLSNLCSDAPLFLWSFVSQCPLIFPRIELASQRVFLATPCENESILLTSVL